MAAVMFTPSKFDSLDQPLQQALNGLNKECRKAGRRSSANSAPAFLPSSFKISHFKRDCVLTFQGIEQALCEELGDVEY
jgi:hypothetical protein